MVECFPGMSEAVGSILSTAEKMGELTIRTILVQDAIQEERQPCLMNSKTTPLGCSVWHSPRSVTICYSDYPPLLAAMVSLPLILML